MLDVAGIDGDFKSSLTAYHDFKNILTGCSLTQDEKEEIIRNITLFGDDKILLAKRLKKQYPQLTEGAMQSIEGIILQRLGAVIQSIFR